MTSINTADVRSYVAQRQAATEMVKQAYDMKRLAEINVSQTHRGILAIAGKVCAVG
jgi:hypothetical protein